MCTWRGAGGVGRPHLEVVAGQEPAGVGAPGAMAFWGGSPPRDVAHAENLICAGQATLLYSLRTVGLNNSAEALHLCRGAVFVGEA
jgi:hypothetical protein